MQFFGIVLPVHLHFPGQFVGHKIRIGEILVHYFHRTGEEGVVERDPVLRKIEVQEAGEMFVFAFPGIQQAAHFPIEIFSFSTGRLNQASAPARRASSLPSLPYRSVSRMMGIWLVCRQFDLPHDIDTGFAIEHRIANDQIGQGIRGQQQAFRRGGSGFHFKPVG